MDFAGKFHGVEDRRADDDRRAVLIVMKHRNRHALAQLALDLETFRRLDVLEIDAAKGGFQRRDDIDEPVRCRSPRFRCRKRRCRRIS